MDKKSNYATALSVFLGNSIELWDFTCMVDEDFKLLVSTLQIANKWDGKIIEEMIELHLIGYQPNLAQHYDTDEPINFYNLKDKGRDLLFETRGMNYNHKINDEIEKIVSDLRARDSDNNKAIYFTLADIAKAFKAECYTGAIALCGKVLEIILFDTIMNSNKKQELYEEFEIKLGPKKGEKEQKLRRNLTLGPLIEIALKLDEESKGVIPNKTLSYAISNYRNAHIHFNEDFYHPEQGEAESIINLTLISINRYLGK